MNHIPRMFFVSLFVLITAACQKDSNPDPNIYTPIASFDFTTTTTGSVIRVSFLNYSENADKYLWEFGDGNTSTQKNPVKDYPRPVSGLREYNVVLTAYDTVNNTLNRKSRNLVLNP